MLQVKITLQSFGDSVATAREACYEGARILRQVADALEQGQPAGADVRHPCMDINGQCIGAAVIHVDDNEGD